MEQLEIKSVVDEKIDKCGKTSVLVKHKLTQEYLGFVAQCKQMSCPSCGTRIQQYIIDKFSYYADMYQMQYFFTFTTGQPGQKYLQEKFSILMDLLAQTEKAKYIETYLRKMPKMTEKQAEKAYYNFVHELFDKEHYYAWLYGKNMTKEEKNKNYIPMSNIALYITDVITKRANVIKEQHIKPLLEWKTGKKIRAKTIDEYYSNHVKKGKKDFSGMTYKDTKKNGVRSEFLNEFDTFLHDIARMQYEIKYDEEARKEYRKYIPKEEAKLHFIRTLEHHKNIDAPHYHGITNFYIPMQLVKQVFGNHIYLIEKARDLRAGEKEEDEAYSFNHYVARYLAKYVTKETLKAFEEMKEDGTAEIDVISSSDGISIRLDEAFETEFKGQFQKIKVMKGALPSVAMKFSNPYDFDKMLLLSESEKHPNTPIQDLIDKFYWYLEQTKKQIDPKDRKKMKEELKQFEHEKLNEALENEIERRKDFINQKLKVDKVKLNRELYRGNLTDDQMDVVRGFLKDNLITFLIGYAGTGKTHTLANFLRNVDSREQNIAVVTYTAQAVERIKEMMRKQNVKTGEIEITTIHKLCGARHSMIDYPIFYNNWEKTLELDLVIIDEFSLIDTRVLTSFMASLKPSTRIIFIGDNAQLNAIHSENPFEALKKKIVFPVYYLTKVLRSGDKIIDVATEVRDGKIDNIDMDHMEFYEEEFWSEIDKYKEKGYQILSNSVAIKEKINQNYQKGKIEIAFSKYHYNIGDEVLITKNDPYKRYFNGEKAIIKAYDSTFEIVHLQNKNEIFQMKLWEFYNRVEPAHAMTVHKSQGSEFPRVLILLDATKDMLMNRNMIYTAITRAEHDYKVIINEKFTEKIKQMLSTSQN